MKKKIISFIILLMATSFFTHNTIDCANLIGTGGIVYQNQNNVFSDGEYAQGFVRMNGGFTIKPGAQATLDTVISVSGSIDLRETGILQLTGDLSLETGLTWSSGGYIKGHKNAIVLGGPLSIPASKKIQITSDTIIDGHGNTLILNEHTQIIVENNATLTLSNIIIQDKLNGYGDPLLKINSLSGKIALKNTQLKLKNNLLFNLGKLYFHDNVTISGSTSILYTSPSPCFIAPSSTLLFDIGTSLTFAPASSDNQLLVLQDKTSNLFFNGSSLSITSTGMRLTKGNLILNNKVTLLNQDIQFNLSNLLTIDYGTRAYSADWTSTGTILAISGLTNGIRVYTFDGSSLNFLTSQGYGTYANSAKWNPAGTVLAIGGQSPSSAQGGFSNVHDLRLYSFNGARLTPLTSKDYALTSGGILEVAWHPSGNFIAIVGYNPDPTFGGFMNTNELCIYSFNGSSLTPLTSQDYGAFLESVAWNSTGTMLAIGGQGASAGSTDELRVYSFNGTTLTLVDSKAYGGHIYKVAWNPAGTVLAVGGYNPTNGAGGFSDNNELRLYGFNGSSLTPITSQDYGSGAAPACYINAMEWNKDGTILAIGGQAAAAVGGFNDTNSLRLYSFNGLTLTPLASAYQADLLGSIAWNPITTTVFATAGHDTTNDIHIYNTNFSYLSRTPAKANMLTFGNSTLGEDYDLNIEVLGGAHVTIKALISDDSA